MKQELFFCVLVFMMVSCRHSPISEESPAINKINTGKKYRITLPENHSTGYIWQLQENYDKKIIEHLNDVWHGNEKGVDFNLRARAAGQTTLTFIKRMYTDTSEIKQFIVKIGEY